MQESNRYATVKKFAEKNRALGLWPDSENSIWALKADSPGNGFGSVFIKVGRRVLIDEEKFWEAIKEMNKR